MLAGVARVVVDQELPAGDAVLAVRLLDGGGAGGGCGRRGGRVEGGGTLEDGGGGRGGEGEGEGGAGGAIPGRVKEKEVERPTEARIPPP